MRGWPPWAVIPLEHSLSTWTIGSLKNCKLMVLIDQKNADMIEAKAFTDQPGRGREYFIQVLQLSNGFGELGNGFQLRCPTHGLLVDSFDFLGSFVYALFKAGG